MPPPPATCSTNFSASFTTASKTHQTFDEAKAFPIPLCDAA
jgi:hypothetical protein